MSLVKKILLFLAVFSVSFDIFLVFKIGEATVRFSNLAVLMLGIVVVFEKLLRRNFVLKYVKYPMVPLVLFTAVSFLSVIGSEWFLKSSITAFYALFNLIFYVWLIAELVKNEKDALFLTKIYLGSFLFVAAFALVQFVLPFVGIRPPLAGAYLEFMSFVPRVNAFSYEPTNLATYLAPGLFLALFMAIKGSKLVNRWFLNVAVVVLFAAVVLSTARVGWLAAAISLVALIPPILRMIARGKIKIPAFRVCVSFFLIFLFVLPAFIYLKDDFLGLVKSAPSGVSATCRTQGAIYVFQVFKENPILGVGVGGVGVYMNNRPQEFILEKMCANTSSIWSITTSTVAAEILASTGIIGFLIWLWLLWRIFKFAWDKKNNILISRDWRIIMEGLLWGFVVQIIVLQFNQNFFRNYVYLHIGMIVAIGGIFINNCRKHDHKKI